MASRYASTAVVMLAVLTGWTRGLADEVVTIGGVAVSAECALARKEHPRLLFTKADVPRLRERLKHPRIAAELRHARQLAAENKAGAILLGLLPTENTYADRKSQRHRQEHDRENSIGLGGWRIELLPQGTPVATNFLVVLHAADQATGNMIPVEGIERPGQLGAKLTAGTTDYEVIFATAGPTGGHIRVTQAGKTTLDRPLATAVEDDYRKWSADTRYQAWMTRPEYRNFMGNGTAETLGPPSRH